MESPKSLDDHHRVLEKQLFSNIYPSLKAIHQIIGHQTAPEDSLLTGNLGLCVYHQQVSLFFKDEENSGRGIQMIEELLENLNESKSTLKSYHYSNGLAGIGTVLQTLIDDNIIEFDMDEEFQVIDEMIFDNAISQIEKGFVEFFHGGGGALFYFAQRAGNNTTVNGYIDRLVQAILFEISKDPIQVRIPRSPYFWNENNDYDLSLSHGLCGLLLIFLTVLEKTQCESRSLIEDYLARAAIFVLNLKKKPTELNDISNYLPSYLEKEAPIGHFSNRSNWPYSRLAWCYGDLGWVLFFYRYGAYTKDQRFIDAAEEIGLATTRRRHFDQTMSSTSHFCHGHSGLAFFYKKLFLVTGLTAYQEASEYWVTETLTQLEIELSTGYHKEKHMETSFLEGLAGTGLVLASFLSPEELSWPKYFLL
jgi:lantibiotic modifying enzyme